LELALGVAVYNSLATRQKVCTLGLRMEREVLSIESMHRSRMMIIKLGFVDHRLGQIGKRPRNSRALILFYFLP